MALLNKARTPQNVSVFLARDQFGFGTGWDFMPADVENATVRDIWARKDLGVFSGTFTAEVQPQSASLYRFARGY